MCCCCGDLNSFICHQKGPQEPQGESAHRKNEEANEESTLEGANNAEMVDALSHGTAKARAGAIPHSESTRDLSRKNKAKADAEGSHDCLIMTALILAGPHAALCNPKHVCRLHALHINICKHKDFVLPEF